MIILDFDGVIVDSQNEVICTIYSQITGVLTNNLAAIPADFCARFRRNRFHVQPAADFLPFAQWCLGHGPQSVPLGGVDRMLSDGEFAAILKSSAEPEEVRRELFFGTRAKLIAHHKERWLSLSPVYEPLGTLLRTLPPSRVVLLTNKNRSAVLDLMAHAAVKVLPENIYSGDNGVTKVQNFAAIHDRFKCESYTFVDDSVKNLRECRHEIPDARFFQCALATWGYVGPDDAAQAAREGFHCYSMQRLMDELQGGVSLER